MSKFTKGPWVIVSEIGGGSTIREYEIRGSGKYPIFNKSRSAVDGWKIFASPDDARLIAAAPELYDALEHCRDVLLRYEINRVDGEAISEKALSIISAALRKADGEQP